MFGKDRLDDCSFGQRFAWFWKRFALWFEIIDVEPKDVTVLDGVGDRVGVKSKRC
jgi:hypothetical protein